MSGDVAELERPIAGALPEGWREAVLSDVAAVNPEALRASTSPDYAFGYIDISQIEAPGQCAGWTEQTFGDAPSRARRKVQAGDILVSTVRPYLRSFAQVPKADLPLVASTGFAVVRAGADADQQFLYQHILHSRFIEHLTPRMTGSNYPAVSAGDVEAYPIPLPPLDEQRRIAEALRSVDEAIAAAEQVANKARRLLVNLGREIMQSPDEEPINGSERLRLLDVCRPKQHPIIGKADLTADGYPVYGANGQIGFAQSFTHADPVIAITCRGATCGSVNWVPAKSYVTGNAMALDHLDRDRMHERFLFHYVSVWGVARSISGSAQPQITRQSLSCIDIIAPDVSHQADIADALDAIEAEANAAENALAAAHNLKAAVMSDLLSGRVRVPA